MTLVTTAILPIVFVLAAGTLLRRWILRDEASWGGLEWTSYRVFLPALFITSLAKTDLSVVPMGSLALSVAVPIIVVAGLTIALRKPLRATGPQLTSMVQGAIRINTYIGLIFASALHGTLGVATFALACAIVVPLVNVISVIALVAYGDKTNTAKRLPLWRELLENPLILGCVIGLVINLTKLRLPQFVSVTLSLFAAPALVCGTLVAGAALSFKLAKRDVVHIGAVSVLKLVLVPLGGAAIAVALGMSGPALTSVLLICAVPTATSANILAARMGGDIRLMASITGVQTVCAMATMPLALAVLHHVSG